MVDPTYLKAQRQKEEEKRRKEEKKKAAAEAALANQQKFQLGDVWGNATGFGGASTGTGFGMKKTTTATPFGATPFGTTTTPFGATPFGTTTKTAASVVAAGGKQKKKTTVDEKTLLEKMSGLIVDPIDTSKLPQFPGQYLYIDEERTDNYDAMGIDMSRYKEYLDMEKDVMMEIEGESWGGETYEKQHLPRGVDKQFKKFTERVECAPTQCVRYGFGGQPLFYGSLQAQQQQLMTSSCPYCHGPRVFEFQLMPNVLSILPTTEYATQEEVTVKGKAKNIDTKTVLDSWNVGMEFGTILVFVCQKDCHPGELEDVRYIEEAIVVQYETD